MNLDKSFLIMDISKCIDCDHCVNSCERRHGAARFVRNGFQVGSIRVPTSCKNCEDPVCIRSCRIDGMTKTNHRFTQPMEICIGCGLCAKNCPFGAIRMIPAAQSHLKVYYEKPAGEIDNLTDKLRKSQDRKKNIWKCDGCADFKNRGCEFNCPTGALQSRKLSELMQTLPLPWARALLLHLSPAILDAGEKELLICGEAKLMLNEHRQVILQRG